MDRAKQKESFVSPAAFLISSSILAPAIIDKV
jgi:hypothetical protein